MFLRQNLRMKSINLSKYVDFKKNPEKVRKISSVDTPWMTQKLKKLDRKEKNLSQRETQ